MAESRLYIKDSIDLDKLTNYGFEYWESNEFNWFESYIKYCEELKYTKVIVFIKDREIMVKYDDGYDYNWLRYEEMSKVKEVIELIEAGLVETKQE